MPADFFDTNVILYVASAERLKVVRAEELLAGGGMVSVQVLNEIANVARRKMNLSWADIREFTSALRGLVSVQPVTVETHESGLALAERYGLSIFDGMIAASALIAGCTRLWSEDMQHGLKIEDRLRISNPFR